jgi:TonB-linked SusC/RagA family outer membrane protein
MRKFKLLLTSAALLLASVMAYGQDITVKGTVKDANGVPVPQAGVVISGTTRGVVTDMDGNYSISVPSEGTLVFSALGFSDQSILVGGRALINVTLLESTVQLEETIVIAYGTSTKSSFTGSAAMVKEEDIEKKITTNVTSALAGSAPGVQLISSSGDPTGSSPTIRIRGIGSMSASNSPLIIVDGVPYEGAISDINPQDVESMSVLKDASASAIYGHRGANGVILITTKKGKSGEAMVKFDGRFGVNSRLIPQYDVVTSPAEYYEIWYKKLYNMQYYAGKSVEDSYAFADKNLLDANNGGLGYQVYTIPAGELFIGRNFKLNPNATLGYNNGKHTYLPDDWYKEAFHDGHRQEYNVSVSGSSDRFSYYASAGFLNDGGMVNKSNYKRYTGRVNAEYQAKDWIRLITNMTFSHSDSQVPSYSSSWGSSGSIFYICNTIAPIYPLYVRDKDGNIMKESGRILYDSNSTTNLDGTPVKRAGAVGNAVRDNEYNDRHQYEDVLVGKWGMVATPFKGLTLSANIGVTSDNSRYVELGSPFGSASGTGGYAYVSTSRMFTVNNQYLGQYKFTIADAHNFDFLVGYEKYTRMVQSMTGYNERLYSPFIGELSNADGHASEDVSSSTHKYMTDGFLGRFQYDYDGKYFLSGSIRRDESSRFAPGHRWGTFGSIGGAWLISKEGFMQNVSFVDMLKLKVSYGVQGNDNLGSYYPYANQYSHSYNEDTGEFSVKLSSVGNEKLTWETSRSLNGGLDFQLMRGRLNGTIELFSRTTTDLLYNKKVPYSSGNPLGYVPTNIGSINNMGFELSLDGNIINKRNFQWTWNANFSHYKNTILALDESVAKDGIKYTGGIYQVGGSLYQAYMYKYAGVDPRTGKGLYYQKVYNDEGKWTGEEKIIDNFGALTQSTAHDDRYDIGSVLPKLFGGFGTSINAYGFDFSVQCSYQLGGRYYDGTYQAYMHTQNQAGSVIHKDIRKAWTPENTVTDVPRWDGDVLVAQTPIDRFVISSDYLSINNITLGYTVPQKLVQKIRMSSLRVYVAGENLAVFSARKGVDPRYSMGIGSMTSGAGFANNSYGAMRNVTAGVTVTF